MLRFAVAVHFTSAHLHVRVSSEMTMNRLDLGSVLEIDRFRVGVGVVGIGSIRVSNRSASILVAAKVRSSMICLFESVVHMSAKIFQWIAGVDVRLHRSRKAMARWKSSKHRAQYLQEQ